MPRSLFVPGTDEVPVIPCFLCGREALGSDVCDECREYFNAMRDCQIVGLEVGSRQ